MSKKLSVKSGFTIIEVVLVLAIAGLIFLMVFYVVPQAMAGQRDGERRQAMARVQSALVQYQTNNRTKRNNLPGAGAYQFSDAEDDEGFSSKCDTNSACSFIKNYLNVNTSGTSADIKNTFIDPDGFPYNMVITSNYATLTGNNALEPSSISAISEDSRLVLRTDANNEQSYTIGGENPFPQHVIYIIPGGECQGEAVVKSQLRHFAVLYQLEGSGVYCGDSD